LASIEESSKKVFPFNQKEHSFLRVRFELRSGIRLRGLKFGKNSDFTTTKKGKCQKTEKRKEEKNWEYTKSPSFVISVFYFALFFSQFFSCFLFSLKLISLIKLFKGQKA